MRADTPSCPRATAAAVRQWDGMWGAGGGREAPLPSWHEYGAGHRLWQGVYMSNTRDGAEVSCTQPQERWSPGPSIVCTGWEGALIHLPAPKIDVYICMAI